jgi:hypothetical protein
MLTPTEAEKRGSLRQRQKNEAHSDRGRKSQPEFHMRWESGDRPNMHFPGELKILFVVTSRKFAPTH